MSRLLCFLLVFVFCWTLSWGTLSLAAPQNGYELNCRAQAKDIAVKTYQTCVSSVRQKRIDEIRREYKTKLAELKGHYEQELQGLDPQGSKKKSPPMSAKTPRTAGLPPKKIVTQAQPITENPWSEDNPQSLSPQTESETETPELIDIAPPSLGVKN